MSTHSDASVGFDGELGRTRAAATRNGLQPAIRVDHDPFTQTHLIQSIEAEGGRNQGSGAKILELTRDQEGEKPGPDSRPQVQHPFYRPDGHDGSERLESGRKTNEPVSVRGARLGRVCV